ncbi:MAG: transposase [bacterium]|nr:transposase [bacterium]
MPQSLAATYLHLLFSTKCCQPFLQDVETRQATHRFLRGMSRRLGCPVLAVGGAADHVHLLSRFSRVISQADWVKELKRCSHLWLVDRQLVQRGFAWQNGYLSFSVSHSRLEDVRAFLRGQEARHRNQGFQEEARRLLILHDMRWDERFLWD